MYRRPASERELAQFGLTRRDVGEEDDIEIWPSNERAVYLFVELGTQWRVGGTGPTGLDYGPLLARVDRLTKNAAEYEALYADVRVLESAALAQMSEDDVAADSN